ncbi:ferric-chelate reductase 1-like [Branchiostoma floridae]|uniref:Ferric-chelate reductase 1-like n=1 Tax=Branchiostoma floridae TaxID=7739 RepID=A0A9J7ME13_BRAFL|nr:ferric-chelate reductase 1-like [Branchiostoma floridae]
MTLFSLTVTVVFLLCTNHGVNGYSSYVPASACDDMVPAHKVPGQTSSPPYELLVDKQTYSVGEQINVTIQQTGSQTFEGFYIQARPVGRNEPVGTFTALDDDITLVVDCAPDTQNAVGHRRTNYSLPIVQKTVVSVIWTAPNVTVGDIQFRATVLQNFTTFWVNALASPVITDPTATQGPTNVPIATGATTPSSSTIGPVVGEDPLGITTDGCGVTKGCYGVPDGCSPPNCDLLSTWVTDATTETVIVEVTGKSDGYVAIGFSRDKIMADDDMYECVRHPTDGNIEVFSSYSTGHSRPTRDDTNSGVSNVEVAYSNGLLSCRFHRAVRQTARAGTGADQYFDLGNSSYHIFLAEGPSEVQSDGSVQIRRHTSRVYSDQPVDVMSIGQVAATSTGATTPPSATVGPVVSEDPLGITTDGCGVTKGCYGVPDGCSPPNCDLLSTWVTDATTETVIVEVTGKSDGYVAIGFSRDKIMADDDMYECVRHPDGNIEVFSSYSTGHSRPTREPTNSGVSNVEVAYSNGLLSCRFHRAVRQTARAGTGADQYFDLGNSSYHIFLASGPTQVQSDGSVQIRRHTSRVYSENPIDVTSISLVATASTPLLVKLHAGLMMSAWMFTVSIGAVLARFYKPMWPNSTWCGVKVWFAVHRAVMILTVLMAVAAFVIIFVFKEWTFVTGFNATIHAVMGIIVTSLAVIQPFMSLLRPGPDEPNRVVFNWFHWGFGTAARIMAIIVMFLGLDFPAMDLPDEAMYVLASWVVWQALSEVILEQEALLKCCGQADTKEKESKEHEEIEMQTQKSPSSVDLNPEPKAAKPSGSGFKNGFLAIYLLVLTGFTAAMYSFIALH